MTTKNHPQPIVCNDARFRTGRKLVQRGLVHQGALKIFSLLMNRAEEEFGTSSLNFAATEYEYGYALFLDTTRDDIINVNNDEDRSGGIADTISINNPSIDTKLATKDNNSTLDTEVINQKEEHLEVALEHMVKSSAILYEYIDKVRNKPSKSSDSKSNYYTSETQNNTVNDIYLFWASEQLSRYLVGIGYVLSYQGKNPDALNSYFNALPFRMEMQENSKDLYEKFKAHRLLVEVYVLIVEEILKCPSNADIETESNDVLIKKEEMIGMAKVYYEKARDELQEAIVQMATLNSQTDSEEKEIVCHLATLVMDAGISLSTVAE